jgi:predicted NBD/HSP70 family sugar kinase
MGVAAASTQPRRHMSSPDIRASNVALLCDVLRRHAPLTRAELVGRTGLARPTVVAILQQLLEDRLVVESTTAPTPGGGRPAKVLRFRSRARVVATARFAPDGVQVALGDLEGTVLARSILPLPDDDQDWQVRVDGIAARIRELTAAMDDAGELAAVALTLPGAVDAARGTWTLPRRPGWTDLPVADRLSRALDVPTTLSNVAAAALVGQLRLDPDRAASSALVYVGRGVGHAATVEGRLLTGATQNAGELGHCIVPGVGTPCECGRHGCLETVTSARYLRAEFRRLQGHEPETVRELEESDDERVHELLTTAARRLGLATSWLVGILDPGTIYLGGSPFLAGTTTYFEEFADAVRRFSPSPAAERVDVLRAEPDSAVAGGLHLATELLTGAFGPSLRLAS